MKNTKLWFLLALALVAWPAFAAQVSMPYRINVTQMQSSLGLGSSDPTRSIQQAAAALQWGGGSNVNFAYQGTTTNNICFYAKAGHYSIITGATTSSSTTTRAPTITSCGSGYYIITVNSYAKTWKTLALSNANPEVAGAVLSAFIQLAGGTSAGGENSNCLSDPGAMEDTFIRSRNQFCRDEIYCMMSGTCSPLVTGAGNYRAAITALKATANDPTPAASWSSTSTPTAHGGVHGFDAMLGWVNTNNARGGTLFSEFDGGFNPGITFCNNGPDGTGSTLETATGFYSIRRPVFALDTNRNVWWAFAHDTNYEDQVKMYSSSDLSTWSDKGTLKKSVYFTYNNGTLENVPISTKMPVGVTFSPQADRFYVTYVQYRGYSWDGGYYANDTDRTVEPWDSDTQGEEGAKAGTLNVVLVNPQLPTSVQWTTGIELNNVYVAVFDGGMPVAMHTFAQHVFASTPPGIACGMESCPDGGGPNLGHGGTFTIDCIAMYTALEPTSPDSRNVGAAVIYDYVSYIPTDGGWYGPPNAIAAQPNAAFVNVSFGTYPPTAPGGATDYPVSASADGLVDAGHRTGVMEFAVLGTDGNVYLNSMVNNRGGLDNSNVCIVPDTYGNVPNATPNFEGWNGVGSTATTAPSVRYRGNDLVNSGTSNEWLLYLGN